MSVLYYHTLARSCGCFKDDNASQWKSGKFDPRSLRNLLTNRHLNLHEWLSRGLLPYAKFHHDTITPFRPPNLRKCASSDSARPLHRFSRSERQMTSFRARMCLLGVPKKNFTYQPYFPPKANFWPIFGT